MSCRWFCMRIITSISFLLRHFTHPAFLIHLLLISRWKINDRLCCTWIKKTGSVCSTQKASLSHMKLHTNHIWIFFPAKLKANMLESRVISTKTGSSNIYLWIVYLATSFFFPMCMICEVSAKKNGQPISKIYNFSKYFAV